MLVVAAILCVDICRQRAQLSDCDFSPESRIQASALVAEPDPLQILNV